MNEQDTIAGVKYASVAVAFFGSALALTFTKELTRSQAIASFFGGAGVAVIGAPAALEYLSLTGSASYERLITFLAALCAMRAVPVLFAIVDRFKDIKLPGGQP